MNRARLSTQIRTDDIPDKLLMAYSLTGYLFDRMEYPVNSQYILYKILFTVDDSVSLATK
jgi:hypothetical protein